MLGADAYKEVLGGISSGTPGEPSGVAGMRNVGSALGAPPPTGTGASNFGGGDALSPRAAASATIAQLAGLKSHFPSAVDRIDGMIAELSTMAKANGDTKAALTPVGAPVAPPIAPPMPPPVPPPAPDLPMPPLGGMTGGVPPMGAGGPPLPPM